MFSCKAPVAQMFLWLLYVRSYVIGFGWNYAGVILIEETGKFGNAILKINKNQPTG